MTATDVMMLGWVGSASALAAGALGTNLYYGVLMIFRPGPDDWPTSPMMARELGRNRFAVREIRRTVRQGLWDRLSPFPFRSGLSCGTPTPILLAMGQDCRFGPVKPGLMFGRCNGRCCPSTVYIVLRSFMAALGASRAGRWSSPSLAVGFDAVANWALIFGHLGFPEDWALSAPA